MNILTDRMPPASVPAMKASLCNSLFVILALSVFSPAKEIPSVQPESVGMSAEKLTAVDAALQQLIADKKIAGCVVVVTRHGELAYFKAFGMADIESGKPMTTDAIFRIFSMTKAITSASAMLLVEEGKLELDAPVSKYLSPFTGIEVFNEGGNMKADPEPTVRDLLRHTAGLSYGGGTSSVDRRYEVKGVMSGTLDKLVERVGEIPLLFQPGTAWTYSVATDVLGAVIEKASGKALDVFFRERIFEPLEMSDTGFQLPKEKVARFTANFSGEL
ncbi:MAG: serine hydrolase, partial [Verrucomicrobia bacterium]|nr:serine hydrolase [Verrucomicrobiota bacterium]